MTKKHKNRGKYLGFSAKSYIFASLFNRKHKGLSYGVMVAQQVLVLFVLVRIQVGQHKKRGSNEPRFLCYIAQRLLLGIIQILVGSTHKHLFKILASLPFGFGKVHKQIVTAIACRSTGHLTIKGYDKLKSLA